VVQEGEKFFNAFPLDRSARFSRIFNAMPAGLYGRDGQPPSNQEQESHRFKHGRGWKQEDASRQEKDVRSEDPSCRLSLLDGAPRGEYFRLVYGPSLTVGMVSGDGEVARRRFSRYEAFAENMEGSAVAQTCFRFKIPMMECRGISNMAGDRDKRNWRLEMAILHCRSIVQKCLRIE
jgi:futalosine hydrolase